MTWLAGNKWATNMELELTVERSQRALAHYPLGFWKINTVRVSGTGSAGPFPAIWDLQKTWPRKFAGRSQDSAILISSVVLSHVYLFALPCVGPYVHVLF